MELSTFAYFLMASILLTLAPGPDNLYLLTKSLSDGAKSGVVLAAGLVSGIIFHTFLVMVGFAAFIQDSPIAFTVLKIFGAVYLIFLAVQSFKAARAGKKISMQKSDSKNSFAELYRRGILFIILPGIPAAIRKLFCIVTGLANNFVGNYIRRARFYNFLGNSNLRG